MSCRLWLMLILIIFQDNFQAMTLNHLPGKQNFLSFSNCALVFFFVLKIAFMKNVLVLLYKVTMIWTINGYRTLIVLIVVWELIGKDVDHSNTGIAKKSAFVFEQISR